MKTKRLTVATLLAALLAGCGGDDEVGIDQYFAAQPYTDSSCNVPDPRLTVRREVRIFTQGIDAPRFTRGLQRYYLHYGLTFFSTQTIQGAPQKYALDTDETALGQSLTKQFPGVDLNDDALMTKDPELYQRIVKSVMNFVFRPIVDFAKTHAAGTQITNLVLVPQILRPGGQDLAPAGGEVAGLAISPALLTRFAAMNTSEGAAWQALDLPADFTPMMFLDGKVLQQLVTTAPVLVDLVAAHEFGHTGGLVHREESHNLMTPAVTPGVDDCHSTLDDDQIQTMRETLGITAGAPLRVKDDRADPLAPLGQLLPPSDLGAILRGDRPTLARLIRRLIP